MKDKRIISDITLKDEELKTFVNRNNVCKCVLCKSYPRVTIKITKGLNSFHAKYRLHCEECDIDTGYHSLGCSVDRWNALITRIKYKDYYIFSFEPASPKTREVKLDNYNFNFKVEQYEINHEKGGNVFLFYIKKNKETKLSMNTLVNNVVIQEGYPFNIKTNKTPKFEKCLVLAKNKEEASRLLNERLDGFFKEYKEKLKDRVEQSKEYLENRKRDIEDLNAYVELMRIK